MNFIDAVISQQGGGYVAEVCGSKIQLPAKMGKEQLGAYVGKTVVLGIRPEDINAVPASAKHDLEATIEIAELMGAEINLHLDCQGNKLVVRAPSTYAGREGDVGALELKAEKIHLFDKQTELAIAH
jgi:multiple sugar transport system ATP-binding protein